MKILLHACCGPCSVYCIDRLKKLDIECDIYWFNPNIHPYTEYKQRRDTLIAYTESIGLNTIVNENYGLKEFTKNVINDLENRCKNYCYRVRLEATAKYAKEHEYEAFSTTLLISPYQNHEMLKQIGEEMAQKYGLKFFYEDFRIGFRQGQQKARELGMYMQKYCGCIFSEQISYNDHIKKDRIVHSLRNERLEAEIRLDRKIKGLRTRKLTKDDIEFVYNVKKEVNKKQIEEIYGEWDEKTQRKLFTKFINENSKYIKVIVLNNENIGFYNGKNQKDGSYKLDNLCIIPEYQNKGIGKAILEEIIFEHKEQEISLQCFKKNSVIEVYKELGFENTNETEYYYQMSKMVI